MELTALSRIQAMPEVECEGDILPYNCSVATNDESLNLVWQLTPPNNGLTLTLQFNYSSQLGTEHRLAEGISAVLHYFDPFLGYAHSVISLTIQQGVVSSGTHLRCGVEVGNGVIDMVVDNLTVGGL